MKKSLFFLIPALILFLFIFLPIAKMLFSISPAMISKVISDKEVLTSIYLSLKIAFLSTIFALIFGIPLAFILARWDFPFKSLFEAIIDIPVMIPHTAAGIALLTVFGSKFLVGKIFSVFGIKFVGTEFGIAIGMMFVSVSYLIHNAKSGFQKVDIKLENVARTLGASSIQTFFKISLPLAKRDIISGSIMMWARGISEFGAVVILTYHPMVAPTLILDRYLSFGLKYSKPIAVVLIIICIFLFLLMRWINNRKDKN